jgi:putative tricarboxylic transport membrane protein
MSTAGQAHPARSGIRDVLTGERIFAAGFVAAGILSVVEGVGYGLVRDDGIIGPGFFPIVIGAILLVLGGGILLQTVRGPEAPSRLEAVEAELEREVAELDTDAAPMFDVAGNERAALAVFAGIGVAILASYWLGLIVAFSLLVFVILAVIERQGLVRAVAVTLLLGFGSWLVFVHFLEVPLGFGIFGQ